MLILIQFLGIKESGPVFTFELAKGLLENGNDVYVVLHKDIENKEQWRELLGDNKIYIFEHWISKNKIFKTSIQFFKELLSLRQKFGRIKFDYSIRTFVSKYDDLLSPALNIKKVVNFCHDPIPHSGVCEKAAKKNKNLINKADKIVVLTKQFIPVVMEEYKRREEDLIFVRHGLLPYSNEMNTVQKTYNVNEKVKYMFFGRIDPYKGLDIFIKAYSQLERKYSNVELIIAGSGDISTVMTDIDNITNARVMNRYIHDYEVDKLFREDNIILVLPYKDATQSGVATVAYEYGVPVIASNTGGLKEQLFDGEVGLLVEPNEVKELYCAMERFLTESNLYDNEAKMMQIYKKELCWDKIADNLIKEVSN